MSTIPTWTNKIRAEVDAQSSEGGKHFQILTKNVTRHALRETGKAAEIEIDSQSLRVNQRRRLSWRRPVQRGESNAQNGPARTRPTHSRAPLMTQSDPFLLVRPTGTPRVGRGISAVTRSSRTTKMSPRTTLRGTTFILIGDPSNNRWIAKLQCKLPVQWTDDTVTLGGQSFQAGEYFPALIYPNPLNPSKYLALSTGLTITDREYNGDYGLPQWGVYAVAMVKEGSEIPDTAAAGLFEEHWRLPTRTPTMAKLRTRF